MPRPRPIEDRQTAPYWAAARQRRLVVQRCETCDVLVHPSMPCCPRCLSDGLGWQQVSGRGRVWSSCVTWADLVPGFVPPYVVAEIALDEQPSLRLTANVVGAEARGVVVGDPVRVVFEDRGDDLMIPQFEISEGGV
jgi:uncharacterized OB-fold protein